MVSSFALAQNTSTAEVPSSAAPAVSHDNSAEEEHSERLQKRKNSAARRFGVGEQSTIRSHCQVVRGLVAPTEIQVKGLEAGRSSKYHTLLSRLEELGMKLKDTNVDTATYDQHMTELKIKIETYLSELATLGQLLADVASIDCAADPEGFALTLLEAKTRRESVIASDRGLRMYVRDALRPALKQLRGHLQDSGEGAL